MTETGAIQRKGRNHVTVHAVANPEKKNRKGRLETLHDKASGYGILRLDPKTQAITMECWKLLVDAADPKPEDQFPGWPKTISVADNYGREAVAWLPTLVIEGADDPVVHIETKGGEHVSSLRVHGKEFRPKVFSKGTFVVTVEHPETGRKVTMELEAPSKPERKVKVGL